MSSNGHQGGNPIAQQLVAGMETSISADLQKIISPIPPMASGGLNLDAPLGVPNHGFEPLPSAQQPRERLARPDPSANVSMGGQNLKKFGDIRKRFPGAERVRIRRTADDGSLALIGEWNMRDVAAAGDVEGFLLQHVVPKKGGGIYHTYFLEPNGREYEGGRVPVDGAAASGLAGPSSNDASLGLVRDLVSTLEKKMQPTPQKSLAEQLQEFKALKAQLGGDGGSDAMMLALMSAQQRPAVDPSLVEAMTKISARLDRMENGAAASMAMPPQAPAPPENPLMTALATALPTLISAAVTRLTAVPAPDPNALTTRDIIALMKQNEPKQQDSFSLVRETMGLMREMNTGKPEASVREKLQEMVALRELASDLTGGGGVANTNIWDALGQLFGNKTFADSFGKILGEGATRVAVTASTPAAPRQPNQITAAAPAGNLPANTAPAAPAQPVDETAGIVFPDSFRPYLARMESAEDDQGRIRAVVEGFHDLRGTKVKGETPWRQFVDAMLQAVASNDKDSALNGLRNWFRVIVKKNLLPLEAAERCVKSFDDQWSLIVDTIKRMMGVAAETPAVVTPAPAATPAAPATAPQPVLVPAPAPESGETNEGSDESSDDGSDDDEEDEGTEGESA